ncbi:hypothetical protein BaRGS_00029913, partial [Batillaria attramentaria]
DRMADLIVDIYTEHPRRVGSSVGTPCLTYTGPMAAGVTERLDCSQPVSGRYVFITKGSGSGMIQLCEVEVLVPFADTEEFSDYTVEVFYEDPTTTTSARGSFCYYYKGPMTLGGTGRWDCIYPVYGRYVRISKGSQNLRLCEVQILVPEDTVPPPYLRNVALNKATQASSEDSVNNPPHLASSDLAVDGKRLPDVAQMSCFLSEDGDMAPYWVVDLEQTYVIHALDITNRGMCCADRLASFAIEVFTQDPVAVPAATAVLCHTQTASVPEAASLRFKCERPITGRYVRIKKNGEHLNLCEVEVLVSYGDLTNVALNKPTSSSSNQKSEWGSDKAVDGQTDFNTDSCFVAADADTAPFWFVDLQVPHLVYGVTIANRDPCC